MQLLTAAHALVHNKYIQELAFYGSLYALVLGAYSSKSAPNYNKKFKKTSSYHLPMHIVTGLTEITRYQIRAAKHDGHVLPNAFDVCLTFVWAWFGLLLTRSLRRGDPSTTRPTYQEAAIYRPMATVLAYVLQDVAIYRAGVKVVNSFIYARAGVFVIWQSGFMRKHSYAAIYALAVPISAVIAIHEANVTGAVGIYISMVMGVAAVNYNVSQRLKGTMSRPNDMITSCSVSDLSLLMMLVLGFADLDVMKEMQRRTSLISDISDDYVSSSNTSSFNVGGGDSGGDGGSNFPGQGQVQWGDQGSKSPETQAEPAKA